MTVQRFSVADRKGLSTNAPKRSYYAAGMPSATEGKTKSATRRDVELANTEVELARVEVVAERSRTIGQGIRTAVIIMAFAVPIWAMQGMIEPLAGKTTVIKASIVVTASLTISLIGNGFQWIKSREQRKTIGRLRNKITDLERRLPGGGP